MSLAEGAQFTSGGPETIIRHMPFTMSTVVLHSSNSRPCMGGSIRWIASIGKQWRSHPCAPMVMLIHP